MRAVAAQRSPSFEDSSPPKLGNIGTVGPVYPSVLPIPRRGFFDENAFYFP